jgi:cytochrome c oxidase cbb3-type subunit 3
MLSSFWHWFVIVLTMLSVFGCWWLLQWTKGISDRDEDEVGTTGHVWDEDLHELNNPLPRWWLYLFHITIVFTLVYLLLYPGLGNVEGVLGWTQLGQYDEEIVLARGVQEDVYARYRDMQPDALMDDPEALGIGRRVFANNCAMCHGSDGRGAPGFPNLADNDWLYGSEFDTVLASITQGRQGNMPPLASALGEEGLPEVVAYVQQLSGQAADSVAAANGEARFNMVCAACHGMDGSGNQALGSPNLTDGIWLHGGDAESITATITSGRSSNMPSHADLLDKDQRRMVAAYVRSLASGTN